MPFIVESIRAEGCVRRAMIRLCGCLNAAEGLTLAKQVLSRRQHDQVYYLDLGAVTSVDKSGVAWLHLFLRWARSNGISVRLLNAETTIAARLATAGISEHGTARRRDAPTVSAVMAADTHAFLWPLAHGSCSPPSDRIQQEQSPQNLTGLLAGSFGSPADSNRRWDTSEASAVGRRPPGTARRAT